MGSGQTHQPVVFGDAPGSVLISVWRTTGLFIPQWLHPGRLQRVLLSPHTTVILVSASPLALLPTTPSGQPQVSVKLSSSTILRSL